MQTVIGSNNGGGFASQGLTSGHHQKVISHEMCVSVDMLMNTVKALVEHFDSKISEFSVSQ